MRVVDGQSSTTYRVRWEIDIDANSPLQAAKRAQVIMRDTSEDNRATFFQVYERMEPVKMEEIDLACVCGYDEAHNPACAVHGRQEKIANG